MNRTSVMMAVLVGAGVLGYLQSRGGLFGRDVRSAAFLNEVAEEVRGQIPMPRKIDDETELTSVEALEGVFVYHYRLVNRDPSDVDADQLVAAIKPQTTKLACNTPELRDRFLKNGVTLRYTYAARDGQKITWVDVEPTACND